jgi:hypothetical protein
VASNPRALARRNLSVEQKAYLRGKRYQAEKKSEGRPEKQLGKNCPVDRTSERIAKQLGVSEKTVRNDAEFAEAVDTIAITLAIPASPCDDGDA